MTREGGRARAAPVAGMWVCGHCGRRLEVVTSSDVEMRQPFTCVCGTAMAPDKNEDARRAKSEPHEASPAVRGSEQAREVRETQVSPTAGIWVCDSCGRRVQVETASEHEKLQPFVCLCGTAMEPGEEHAPREQSSVWDD